ncbi:hypothetical protein FPQ18DRAFT_323334 [Pyronema domesticum]|nr:hypothetical protein FPQ18DRAFT_323334 [Pyronema domesticum]
MTIDEEEDTSRGDILDHFSPRELALQRYTQHHEWMEEVIGSAYRIGQIQPVELGLGLEGTGERVGVEGVTRGLELGAPKQGAPKTGEIKTQKEVLEELRKRAEEKMGEMEKEMEELRKLHDARMRSLAGLSVYRQAEMDLRGGLSLGELGLKPLSSGEEEETMDSVSRHTSPEKSGKSVEEVKKMVEEKTGRKIEERKEFVVRKLEDEMILKLGGVTGKPPVLGGGSSAAAAATVAAAGAQSTGAEPVEGMDTQLDGMDERMDTLQEEEFKLDIPTPNEEVYEDQIMADFMETAEPGRFEEEMGAGLDMQ